MNIPFEDIFKVAEAFIAGSLLGLEREYRNKPAGLRTLILITVGSTLFSLLSIYISNSSPDRIASNIVTGVGFVGAGVIFKEGMSVKGITTAATIWVAAAIGMAIGFGSYWLAIFTLGLSMVVLIIFPRLEEKLDTAHLTKTYCIRFSINNYSLAELEKTFQQLGLKFAGEKLERNQQEITVIYKITAVENKCNELTAFLLTQNSINGFEV